MSEKFTPVRGCKHCVEGIDHTAKEHFENLTSVIRETTNLLQEIEISVDLKASGYEWECPCCDSENTATEWTERVTCRTCKKSFEANPPDHVYE